MRRLLTAIQWVLANISCSCGGTGVWDGTKLWTSDNFVKAVVLSNGPRRAAFKLTYAPWSVGSAGSASETKQFTVDCGRNFDTGSKSAGFAAGRAPVRRPTTFTSDIRRRVLSSFETSCSWCG